jgi:gliding motility-associated-like protein
MNKNYTLIIVVLLCFFSDVVLAQSDCSTALSVCDDSTITFDPSGIGSIDDFASANNQSGCLLSQEDNSQWIEVTFDATMPANSVFEFTATSVGTPVDTDMAVWGPNPDCGNLGSPVACNFSASDIAGLSNAGGNSGYASGLTVQPGETYLILVNDYAGDGGSMSLAFDGTAPNQASDYIICDGCNLSLSIGSDITLCEGASSAFSASISNNSGSEIYSWSSIPASATAYLSSTNTLNPSILLPAGVAVNATYTLTVTDGACIETASIVVSTYFPPLPAGDNPSFCAGQVVTLAPGVFTSYQWSTTETSSTITVAAAGVYTVTVTDANMCTAIATFNVSELPLLDATITGGPTFCTGGSVDISAPAGYTSYAWSTTESSQTITVSTAGTYTVTVTDANMCIGIETIDITEATNPPVAITPSGVLCDGGSIDLDAGPGYISYAWSPSGNTQTISVSNSGTYSVTVEGSGGCTYEGSIDITQAPPLTPSISGTTDFCIGTSTTLSVAGGSFTDYIWSDMSTDPTLTVTSPGTVSVTVTDANGCNGETSVDITENPLPTPMITGDLSICIGTSTILDAGGGYASYSWTGGGSGQTNDYNSPGTYSVTVTDGNGCEGETSVTITEDSQPTPVITGDLMICPDQTTTLDAGAGYTYYSWTGGGSGQTNDYNSPGTYSVTVTDGNGCEGETSVTVTENTPPVPNITGVLSVCADGDTDTELDAGGGFVSYFWTGGGTMQTNTVTGPGSYSVTVTDEEGCEGEQTVQVDEFPVTDPVITGDDTFCPDQSGPLDAGAGFSSYSWSPSGNSQVITASGVGTYSVTVTDGNGCETNSDFTISPAEVPNPTISGALSFCENDFAILTADAGYVSYNWTGLGIPNGAEYTVGAPGFVDLEVTNDEGCVGITSVEVVQNLNPEPQITGNSTICQGETGFIDAGAGYASYLWSNGWDQQVLGVNDPDTYMVTVTDFNGCEGSAEIEVEQSSSLGVAISGDLSFCEGGSTILDVGPGYTSYEWEEGQETASIEVTAAGTYSVTVTNATGCSGETSVVVEELALPEPVITGDFGICENGSTILSISDSYDGYLWPDGSTNPTYEVTEEGVVSVVVTDSNGCQGWGEATISIIPPEPISISGTFEVCEGGTTELTASGSFASYAWSNGDSGQTITISELGIYTVTGTTAAGCESISEEVEVTLQPTVISITGDIAFCEGTSTTLNVTPGFDTYNWSNGLSGESLEFTEPGIYTVTASSSTGCFAEAEVELMTYPSTSVSIVGSTSYCPGGAAELSSDGVFESYLWSDMSDGSDLTVTSEGLYGLTVTDSNGCEASDEINVVEQEELNPVISGDLFYCEGGSTSLDVGSSYATYAWSTSDDTQTAEVLMPGEVTVFVTDAFGCSGQASAEVVENPNPVFAIDGEDYFCSGDTASVFVNDIYETYSWSDGTTEASTATNTPGILQLTVTDINGCAGSASFEVEEMALPVPGISGALSYCPDLETTLFGEAGFESYEWTGGVQGTTLAVNTPGDYELTIEDAFGCVGTNMVTVQTFITADPQITGVTDFCPGDNTTLEVSNSFESYSWSNGGLNADIMVDEASIFDVVVTDINGCETTGSIETSIFVVAGPVITGGDAFCSGDNVQLDAGAGFMDYNWSSTDETQMITVTTGDQYTVTVTDGNGCETESSYLVTENQIPEVNIGGSSSYCIGSFTTLNAGAVYDTYVWSTGSDQSSIDVSSAETFSLTVTDEFGCQGEGAVDVTEDTELNPVISGPLDYCETTNTTLDAGSGFATYVWSDSSGSSTLTVNTPGIYGVTVTDAGGCIGSTSVEVAENPLPIPQITGTLEFCEGNETTLNAGSGFSTYTWSDNSGNETLTVDQPGMYSVIVSNEFGCLDTTTVEVEQRANPVFSILGTTYFCEGSSTMLEVDGIFTTYEWADNTSVTNTSEVTTGGIAGVLVSNEFGCETYEEINVEEINLPIAAAGDDQDLDCEVLSTVIGSFGTSTGSDFTYQWAGPGIDAMNETLLQPEINLEGQYTLVVTDTVHNCISDVSMINVVDLAYVPDVSLLVDDELDCITDVVQIDGSGSQSGQDIIYRWRDGVGNIIIDAGGDMLQVTQADTYSLEVMDMATGCNNMDSIDVTEDVDIPLTVAGDPGHLDCNILSYTLDGTASETGGNISYSWEAIQGNISGGSLTSTPEVNEPGIYVLTVLNEDNGCEGSDDVVVTQNIVAPVANAGENQEIDCHSETVTINASSTSSGGSITFSWSYQGDPLVQNGLIFEVSEPGIYSLFVENEANGCSSESEVVVTIDENAPMGVLAEFEQPTCFGDTDGSIVIEGIMGGSEPFLYSINGGAFTTNSSFQGLQGGVYSLVVQDVEGCEYEEELILQDGNDLQLDLGEDLYIQLGEDAAVEAIINVEPAELLNITWQAQDSLDCVDLDCLSFTAQPFNTTNYTITITDENGCVRTEEITVFVDRSHEVFIPNVFSPNGDGNNDVFTIFGGRNVEIVRSFLIFNRWGEPVFQVYDFPVNNPAYGWDGNDRAKIYNAQVFTYFAEVEFIDGEVILFKGDVTLMK